MGIRSYLWNAEKKPGFWVSGGFGVDGGGLETGFLLWVLGVICGMRRRNPVSGLYGLYIMKLSPIGTITMKSALNLAETIAAKMQDLSSQRQQQVLDFIEFLLQQDAPTEKFLHPDGRPMSALEAAGDLVGCIEGPGDLSMKKQELKRHPVQ
ncbi:DUF2281 domain-containing protein [Planktothricoides raciborskii]|nr:DUF2281 domain-containing protein [Planktothricoides raciborskii]